MLLCIYENRAVCEPAVRLLIASLRDIVPGAKIRLFHNPGSRDFGAWVAKFANVEHRPASFPAELAFNVKPMVLLEALDDGHEDVFWLDSDLIIARDFVAALATLPAGTLVATEEALWGARDDTDALRTRAWKLPVGRSLPFTLNSCVLRVSQSHRDLLSEWLRLLGTDEYLRTQALHWRARRPHMSGDQDVLTALICSKPFADVPVHILRRGRDILQLMAPLGFTVRERLEVARRGLPFFIHAQGNKPWMEHEKPENGRNWLEAAQAAYADTSPYIFAARRYRDELSDASWLKPRTALGNLLRKTSLGSPAMAGLPLALMFDGMHAAVKVRRPLRTGRSATSA